MNFSKISDRFIVFSVVVFSIIGGLALYSKDSPFNTPIVSSVIKIILYFCVFISFICLVSKLKQVSMVIFIPLVYWIYTTLDSYGSTDLDILNIIILSIIVLVPSELQVGILSVYRRWIILLSVLGIISYFSYVWHWGFPYTITRYYATNTDAYYVNYNFSYLYINGTSTVTRLCGLFNEPGFFGTILALMLCIDEFNPKHIGNWVMLFAGILTFSVAYIVMVMVWIVLRAIKNKKVLILLIAILVFYFFILPTIKFNDPNIATLVSRLTLTDNGIAGDNRSTPLVDALLKETMSSKYLFFGHGGGYTSVMAASIIDGISTYKTYIIDYGVIGFTIIYGPLLAYSIRYSKKNWSAIMLVLVFFLSVMQRPNIYSAPYFVILLYGIYYIKNKKSKNSNEQL